jgi:hypothetical protein
MGALTASSHRRHDEGGRGLGRRRVVIAVRWVRMRVGEGESAETVSSRRRHNEAEGEG